MREFGYYAFTGSGTTGNLVTQNTTSLADLYDVDTYFKGWYCQVAPTGINAIRRVSDYDVTGAVGTLTLSGSALPSAGATSVAMRLHRVNPSTLLDQFNRAKADLYPHVAIVRDVRLATGQRQFSYTLPSTVRGGPVQVYLGNRDAAAALAANLFTDPGFENWSSASALVSWTATDLTIAREAETTTPKNYAVLHDGFSVKCTATLNTLGTLLQTVTPSVATEGVEINVSKWVYCLTAGRVSIRIGSSDGTAHGGTGWELLHHTATLAATATNFSAGIVVSSGAVIAFYVDEAIGTLGQSEAADREWDALLNWRWVPPVAGASNGGTLELDYPLPEKRRIRVMGLDLLSTVTTDDSTIEVDGEVLQLLHDKTRLLVAQEMVYETARGLGDNPSERAFWQDKVFEYGRRVDTALAEGKGAKRPKPRLTIPDWMWE